MSKLIPLWRSGSPANKRPPGCPSLVNGQPANAAVYFEDFYAATVAPYRFTDGVLACAHGHPSWEATAIGAGGAIGCTATSAAPGGLVFNPTGAGDGFVVDSGGRSTTTAACLTIGGTISPEQLMMVRMSHGTGSSNKDTGFGWIASTLANGTNWLADPDTTLAATNALVITQHWTSAYSGDTAGDVVARLYSTGGTDNAFLQLVPAASANTVQNKYEVRWIGGAYYFWYNGAYIGTLPTTVINGSGAASRFSMSFIANAASKTCTFDCYYQEVGLATAR
jgi:hypothetical protein